jgi:hypothetical protein
MTYQGVARDYTIVVSYFLAGLAILEDFIAIPILGGQNCREWVNF